MRQPQERGRPGPSPLTDRMHRHQRLDRVPHRTALDGFVPLVCLADERGRAPAQAASPQPADVLVCPDRDDSPDAAAAQVLADRVGRTPCRPGHVRPGAGPAPAAGARRQAITLTTAGAPLTCPPVRTQASGRQRLSAARWVLVISPPRNIFQQTHPLSPGMTRPGPCPRVLPTSDAGSRAAAHSVSPLPRAPRPARGSLLLELFRAAAHPCG
jgi:hypothetical protein